MHNLFLGELRHHCRDVWGINVKDNAPDAPSMRPHPPDEQQKWLDHVVLFVKKGIRSKLTRVRRGYIAAVAELNGAIPAASTQLTKEKCVDALLRWANRNAGQDIRAPPVLPEPTVDFHLIKGEYDISKFNILDQPTINQLRQDIVKTSFPSWLERPPRNFGSPSHGKLKADHWRTVCTVSMVITLVRLWGSSTASPKQKALLDNFIHLVSAVDLATRRSVDQDRIDKFDDHLMQYLAGLQRLFDWHHLVPNHHLSLHLKECLELFGPVHAWWAFPFERYNGLLQGLNTNSKTNAMPLTFMRYFYIGANVRSLMSTTEWPRAAPFDKMVEVFDRTFKNVARGTRVADFRPVKSERKEVNGPSALPLETYDASKATSLPRVVYDALVSRISKLSGTGTASFTSVFAELSDKRPRLSTEAQHVKTFAQGIVKFSTYGSQPRNANIIFTLPDDAPSQYPRAGRIQDIVLHVRTVDGTPVLEPFFIVEEHVSLSAHHATMDPFRCYEDIQSRLFYARFQPSLRVLALSDIRAHFAALACEPSDIGESCVVVRSLDRVSRPVCVSETYADPWPQYQS
ncbi:hypothetical protein BV20DRAFT_932781 [Pilatotrama ljubarskyi]|nr:hypothetical protein BV20DRAFT_932781 [Pilatotrama ljubarskyi]